MNRKPTTLPVAPGPPLRPRSLPGTAAQPVAPSPATAMPTALPQPSPSGLSVSLVKSTGTPLSPQTPHPPRPTSPAQPTRVTGQALTGPDLPLSVWQHRFPGERLDLLEAAQARLRGSVVPRSAQQAARWGADSQAIHSMLAERSLALGSAPALQDTQRHLQRLQTLLQTLALAMQRSMDGGMLARLQTSVWDKLQRHRDEILWLRGQLHELLPLVEQNSLQWQTLAADALQAQGDMTALGLATTLLAEQPGMPLDTAHTLAGRATSLDQGSAGLLQAHLLATQRAAGSLALLALVQDAVLLQLPQCLDQLQALQHDAAMTPSKMDTLNTRLQDLARRFG